MKRWHILRLDRKWKGKENRWKGKEKKNSIHIFDKNKFLQQYKDLEEKLNFSFLFFSLPFLPLPLSFPLPLPLPCPSFPFINFIQTYYKFFCLLFFFLITIKEYEWINRFDFQSLNSALWLSRESKNTPLFCC